MEEEVYRLDGVLMLNVITPSVCERVKNFQFNDHVVIASYPKAGITWLQEITWLIMNDCNFEKAKSTQLSVRFPHLEYFDFDTGKLLLDVLDTSPDPPKLIKTHLFPSFYNHQLRSETKVKFIVIVRNPKDLLVSYFHFLQTMEVSQGFAKSWSQFFDNFLTKNLLFGDYFDFYRSWLNHLDDPNVLFVKYEDMKRDLAKEISRLSQFLGKTMTDEDVKNIAAHTDFEAMKHNKMTNWELFPLMDQTISPFMRAGKVGGWRELFTEEQSRLVDEMCESAFGNSNFDVVYS